MGSKENLLVGETQLQQIFQQLLEITQRLVAVERKLAALLCCDGMPKT